MAVYFVTGKLGSGKSLSAVGRIRDYMKQGRRVATNLDIYPEKLLSRKSREIITRLPDKPRIEDLELLGTGDGKPLSDYDESRFGLLVLDEMASWFNARGWADKSRHAVIEWFLHARKLHWDILFLIQDLDAVDKQLRGALCEHFVVCRRLDRIALPFLGPLTKIIFGKPLSLPKAHLAIVRYGDSHTSMIVDRWWYRGADLYTAYATGQSFRDDFLFRQNGDAVDMRASYSVLSAWHLVGRYHVARDWWALLRRVVDAPFQFVLWRVLLVAALAGRRSLPAKAVAWGIAGPKLAAMHRREKLLRYGRRLRAEWGI